MEQNQDSSAVEELPRCQTVPRISQKLEEKIAALTNGDVIPVLITIKDSKVSRDERKKAEAIIAEKHPNLFTFLRGKNIRHRYVYAIEQVVAEVNSSQYNGLKEINHGEIISFDYNGHNLNDYSGLV